MLGEGVQREEISKCSSTFLKVFKGYSSVE